MAACVVAYWIVKGNRERRDASDKVGRRDTAGVNGFWGEVGQPQPRSAARSPSLISPTESAVCCAVRCVLDMYREVVGTQTKMGFFSFFCLWVLELRLNSHRNCDVVSTNNVNRKSMPQRAVFIFCCLSPCSAESKKRDQTTSGSGPRALSVRQTGHNGRQRADNRPQTPDHGIRLRPGQAFSAELDWCCLFWTDPAGSNRKAHLQNGRPRTEDAVRACVRT